MSLSQAKLPKSLGLDGERLAAFYQPIIAMDTRRIIGYEVLGRACKDDQARSLGPFFGDPDVPAEDHIVVDRILREQAIQRLSKTAGQSAPLLFINLKPNWMHRYTESGELYTLSLIEKYRIDPKRIVLEITEESFNGSMEELRMVIDLYRSRGCLIAIDDVGSGFSNTDRIAHIQPNLLKIDMHMIKRSATHGGYLGALRSFSTLAEQIGASLLVEGVETKQDLARAIDAGARYVQGYLFAQAEPDFQKDDRFSGLLEKELGAHLRSHLQAEYYWRKQSEKLVQLLSEASSLPEDGDSQSMEMDQWIHMLLPKLHERSIRVYLCGGDGIQLSSNFSRNGNQSWRQEDAYQGANWSWRPYFIPNLVQLNDRQQAIVSRSYTDLDTREWIRTISVMTGRGCILFVDMRVPDADVQLENCHD
ncbi:EAL domain-containing protein [Paenibacillus sp. NPDC058071]|uniref:EAL domain-containing protein n=1 Tax=Paenibacillus sp. NPDC058071 TaxID=3346326 RepID=UPI0036D8142C